MLRVYLRGGGKEQYYAPSNPQSLFVSLYEHLIRLKISGTYEGWIYLRLLLDADSELDLDTIMELLSSYNGVPFACSGVVINSNIGAPICAISFTGDVILFLAPVVNPDINNDIQVPFSDITIEGYTTRGIQLT